jgi:RNA polymerase sigma-70 factor (ECF subfamily)
MSELVLSATSMTAPRDGADPTSRADDASLVRELQRTGDDELFRILVQRHKRRVFRVAAAVLGPGREAEAEDLTQEAFLLAFRKLGSFRGDSAFSTWLLRVTRNLAIDRRRRADLRKPHVSEDELAKLPAVGAGANPEEAAAAGEQRERLLRQLALLPEPQRTAVYLHYWLESPVAEMAELLELKPETVKSHLHRARQRLAGALAPRCGDA